MEQPRPDRRLLCRDVAIAALPDASARRRGAGLALGAAVLFGFSTPISKLLIDGGGDPLLLAGLFYVGSALGLAVVLAARKPLGVKAGAPLRWADWPWMAAITLTGAAAPALLMIGLAGTAAALGALLLNVEGVATIAIAWVVLREHVDARFLAGAAAILLGAAVLAWRGPVGALGLPALAIVGSCFAWATDSILMRKLSGRDPVQLGAVKGVTAGAANLALAFSRGAGWPTPSVVAGGLIVGLFAYGVTLVMFILALRSLGAARTIAYFSCAPFLGAALALVMFHEPVTAQLITAAALMGLGLYLHLTDKSMLDPA